MMPFEAMKPERLAFLYELYKRSEGDPRRGVPFEELIDALAFGERVTKCIQHTLQQEGLVELTAVPRIPNVGRPVIDHEHRRSSRQTIGMTHHGVRLIEEIVSNRAHTEPPHNSASQADG
jgi:hypothetical protein